MGVLGNDKSYKSELDMIAAYSASNELAKLHIADPLANAGMVSPAPQGSMTCVSNGMTVIGNIESDDAVFVAGKVNGNITTSSDVGINGLVTGDITGRNVHFQNAGVRGNTTASDSITLDKSAVIVGDITAEELSIDGKIKGIARAFNKVTLEANSLVSGEIISNGISIKDGARISAAITISNTDVADDSFAIGMEE